MVGTVEEHVGRFRELAEAGVQTAIVRMARVDVAAVERFAPVVAAFRGGRLGRGGALAPGASLPPQGDPQPGQAHDRPGDAAGDRRP